jgi:hypothetical protein
VAAAYLDLRFARAFHDVPDDDLAHWQYERRSCECCDTATWPTGQKNSRRLSTAKTFGRAFVKRYLRAILTIASWSRRVQRTDSISSTSLRTGWSARSG